MKKIISFVTVSNVWALYALDEVNEYGRYVTACPVQFACLVELPDAEGEVFRRIEFYSSDDMGDIDNDAGVVRYVLDPAELSRCIMVEEERYRKEHHLPPLEPPHHTESR